MTRTHRLVTLPAILALPLSLTTLSSGQIQVNRPEPPSVPAVFKDDPARVQEVLTWFRLFHANPAPDKALPHLQELVDLGEFRNGARGWPAAAILGELLKRYPERAQEWCAALDGTKEPSRFWVYTGIWYAMTEQTKAFIATRQALPKEDPLHAEYAFFDDRPPGSILTRRISGAQQLEMLVNTFGITGNSEYVVKLIDSLNDAPKDDPKISEKGHRILKRVIEAVKVELARGCRRDPAIRTLCEAHAQSRPELVATRVREVLALAEGETPIADAPPIAEPKTPAPAGPPPPLLPK
jgi:hypothetical protein